MSIRHVLAMFALALTLAHLSGLYGNASLLAIAVLLLCVAVML